MTDTRIAVVGASGVGKTTLVVALAPLLALPVIPELARDICLQSYGAERIGDIPADKQEKFKFDVLESQINRENELGSFISDRSTIDAWVLWQRWNICSAMTYDTEKFYQRAREQAALYTHIVYVEPTFAPPEDGFRWTEPDYQKQIDRLTRMTMLDFALPAKRLDLKHPDRQERLNLAREFFGAV